MTDQPAPTIGEVLRKTMRPSLSQPWGPGVFFEALGIDAATPAAELRDLHDQLAELREANARLRAALLRDDTLALHGTDTPT